MKRIILTVVVFIVVVIGIQQGVTYFSRRTEEKREAPAVITGSYSKEDISKSDGERFRTITWEDLMPADWNPVKSTDGLKIEDLQDNDPRAMEALRKTVEAWKNAPVNPAINGMNVRIGGFAMPLEYQGNALKEFLLVPYYGACIHTPPPPSNQIIHVILKKPVRNIRTMDAVWATGNLQVERKDTVLGISGYTMQGLTVMPYTEEGKKETRS